ncbi:MAG: molecular chaperone HtpG [Nitrospirae bacterium]|nr:molecular chaperone HtpG [Nitrospirota bacterium]
MQPEKYSFKTEVNQLLDLMIHSLYSHKEVSIREIISNASDAIDKARYESLTNPEIIVPKEGWKIRIAADRDAGTLTISDNGTGMARQEAVEALGTIAHSGTKEFIAALKQKNMENSPDLIGQFGVGFYSSFMIADKVTLISRKAAAKDDAGIKWESTADGSFFVEDTVKTSPGTDVILHIKQDEKKYLDEWQIRDVVSRYSDYIEYPILMDIVREEDSALEKGKKVPIRKEEQINSGKAIWLRDKADIPETEYHEFYKHISRDFADPLKVIHYRAEGTSEFTCLLYIPSHAPLDIFYKEFRIGPSLYVRKVQIMDHCEELIPPYLRFIKGIVDSSDLPLNVSREILQNNRQVTVMKNNITKKVLDTLGDMKKNDSEAFRTFSREFGRVLKEGIHYDFAKKETIADLLLFSSTASGGVAARTLEEYVAGMKEDQSDIYYMTGSSLRDMADSPYLEAFRAKGYEVLFMTDDIDDLIFSGFEYKGRKFKSVLKGDITLEQTAEKSGTGAEFDQLRDFMKTVLKDDVKDVRISGRLKDSPCCIVGDEDDIDPRMEKMLKAMGQEVPVRKNVLEINPGHPIFASMKDLFEKDNAVSLLEEYSRLLLDQALLLAGERPKDPARFSRYLSHLMVEEAKHASHPDKA